MKRKLLISIFVSTTIISGIAYGIIKNPRASEIIEFQKGHTHDFRGTIRGTNGAIEHSGGTDRYGCHNGSVPYHCH